MSGRRCGPRRTALRWLPALALAATAGCGVAGASVASVFQQVEPAAEDLRNHDVTFEEGALSDRTLEQLDSTTADLQSSDGYLKVIVLSSSVQSYDDTRDFADAVRTELGGRGRVIVFAVNDVGIASNVDSRSQIIAAENAASDALNDGASYATATVAAARNLAGGVSSLANDVNSDAVGTSGAGMLLVVLAIFAVGVLGLMWWASRRMRKGAEAAEARDIGAAETKVREAVDRVANGVLDLADRVEQPGVPAEAKAAFADGAQLFTETQEMLENADTRPELEAAYPKIVDAEWKLDTARALIEGQPAPARPEVEPLFPKVVTPAPVETVPAQAPAAPPEQPHYRQPESSPWLTTAAMAAMALLSKRGMSIPRTRPAMDDGVFGSWSIGLPPSPSAGGGGGGGGSRGMGSRRRGMGSR